MKIDVVTIFPRMVDNLSAFGVTGRAIEHGLLELATWNPRDFTDDPHRRVDDRPYGGGPGMVMRFAPLQAAIQAARRITCGRARTVYLSPQGRRLDQAKIDGLMVEEHLLLVAGRYEGIDERLIELEIDEELSIGDYVLSGGELAAMVLIDALARLQPGALGDECSAGQDSFMDSLLDYPHYTRPETVAGKGVPDVLLSGHHGEIQRWRRKQALARTHTRRTDLLASRGLSDEEQALLDEYLSEHAHQDIKSD